MKDDSRGSLLEGHGFESRVAPGWSVWSWHLCVAPNLPALLLSSPVSSFPTLSSPHVELWAPPSRLQGGGKKKWRKAEVGFIGAPRGLSLQQPKTLFLKPDWGLWGPGADI